MGGQRKREEKELDKQGWGSNGRNRRKDRGRKRWG